MILDEIPGRLDIHKKLGTYHFDKTSDIVDFEYFGRIDMPPEWWDGELSKIIDNNAPVPITPGELKDGASYFNDIGQASLLAEQIRSDHLSTDVWFDRYIIDNSSQLINVNNFLRIRDPAIRIARQQPLQSVALHIDHEHNQIFYNENQQKSYSMNIEESCGDRGAAKKFLIAMHDLDPETLMFWGNSVIPQLKQGDVFSWKYAIPHWTVNFSNNPRYMIGVTGQIDRQEYIDKFNYDYTDKSAYPTPMTEQL